MSQPDVDAAIARGQVAAAAIERVRGDLAATMRAGLAIAGDRGLRALVAGVELMVLNEFYSRGGVRHD